MSSTELQIGRVLRWLAVLTVAAVFLWPAAAQAQSDIISHRISHPLLPNQTVRTFDASPDGAYAVYLTGGARSDYDDLYSVPIQGGSPVQLNDPLTGSRSVFEFRISPDSRQVVYLSNPTLDLVQELLSVPIDRSSAPVSLGSGGSLIRGFAVTPDSSRVVYVAGHDIRGGLDLFSVPIDGSAGRTKLSNVQSRGIVDVFEVTPDGERVVYIADQNLDEVFEIFVAPVTGDSPSIRLSGPMIAGGDVQSFQISPDGSRVLYLADQESGGIDEVFSVPIDGGVARKLNPSISSGADVVTYGISPDSSVTIFVVQEFSGQYHMYRVPTDGSAASIEISQQDQFVFSPNGQYLIYESGSNLRRLGFDDGLDVRITASELAGAILRQLAVGPDSQHVYYIADQFVTDQFTLWGVPVDGTTSSTKLSGPETGDVERFFLSPDGASIFYYQFVSSDLALFRVPADGSAPPTQISDSGTDVPDGALSPDDARVLFRSDPLTPEVVELFSAFDTPLVSFTQSGYVVAEDGSIDTTLAVQRSGVIDTPASIEVTFANGTSASPATGGASIGPGVDFENKPQTILFASYQTTATVPVAINPDGVGEDTEDFSMHLGSAGDVVIDGSGAAIAYIKDSDQTPVLQNGKFVIAENLPNGAQVGTLATSGAGPFSFSIESGNAFNAFSIGSSGVLAVSNSTALNFEVNPLFDLAVKVIDGGGSFDTASVVIGLTDVNEAPLAQNAVFYLPENSPAGKSVGTVQAADPEADKLAFSANSSVFSISSSTGVVTVKDSTALDYEKQPLHSFTYTTKDPGGLTDSATVTIKLLDVDEIDPNAIYIDSLSPTYATAGGSSFWLRLSGKNFTSSSVVRWNGSSRRTYYSSSSRIYGLISSTDIAKSGKAIISVVDGKRLSENALSFPIYSGKVGTNELEIQGAGGAVRSIVGLTTTFTLTWTHTSLTWREMELMDLRIRDEENTPLWIRYTEAFTNGADASTITLLNADGTPAGIGGFGENKLLENDTVLLDLSQTQFVGSGPTGSSVSVRLPVTFKEAAAGALYNIELYAVDDEGGEQGPDIAGTWEIGPNGVFLPAIVR